MAMHAEELQIDEPTVTRLIAEQLPEYADLPVSRLEATGSSNALFRLGDQLLVRAPRERGGSATIQKEARWSPAIAAALPVQVPTVVALGRPTSDYPESWSVVDWVDGTHPAPVGPGSGSRESLARDLGASVRALRELEVPTEALEDDALRWYRAGPLAAVDEDIREYADECRAMPELDLDVDAALAVWSDAVAVSAGASKSTVRWVHGDLLAENLLVRDGRLAAVLDLGGLSIGDPAVDAIAAWELLGEHDREVFRAEADIDEQAWVRGRAWALAIALMTFPYYWRTMPERCSSRLVMAAAVLDDAAAGSRPPRA